MVRSWVVEIDSTFDEPQPKNPHIKIEVPLRIACDRSDVMKATDFVFHHTGYLMLPTFSGKPFTPLIRRLRVFRKSRLVSQCRGVRASLEWEQCRLIATAWMLRCQ